MELDVIKNRLVELNEQAQSEDRSIVLLKRIIEDSNFNLFVGINALTKYPMLLLKISPTNIPTHQLPRCKGFEVHVFSSEELQGHYIQLIITDKKYKEIFFSLVYDIATNVIKEKTEIGMLRSFLGRITDWKQFFDEYNIEGLSENEQRGLYGELWFLRKYLLPSLGIENSIESWKGPYKKPQDFLTRNIAIDIKTNITKAPQKIHIANELQLDNNGLNALFIKYVPLILSENLGETLPGIIYDIKEQISSDFKATRKFGEALFKAGYLDINAELYTNKYLIKSTYNFHITDGFPRIIGSDLRNGVGDVNYTVMLSECMHYLISDDILIAILEGKTDGIGN